MTGTPVRVAFAGLAHSHPWTDAGNLLRLGAQVVGVHDRDPDAVSAFAARTGAVVVPSSAALLGVDPDIIVATPRPEEWEELLGALAVRSPPPVFANKVVAGTPAQLDERERALPASARFGTSSVLRFAPAIEELAAVVHDREVLGIRVRVQHDNTPFLQPDRAWQDDPARGGGTLVTVGVHAWEIVDRLLPGAEFTQAVGWTRRRHGSTTRSEDAAGATGLLRMPGAAACIPVQVLVAGVPGPGAYGVEVVTDAGILRVELDLADANRSLGFLGLAQALLAAARRGQAPAPWPASRVVVANTVVAARCARRPAESGGAQRGSTGSATASLNPRWEPA